MIKLLSVIISLLLMTACAKKAPKTVSSKDWSQATNTAVNRYAPKAEKQLTHYFKQAQVSYPPQQIALLAFKKEKKIELWAKDTQWHLVHNYPLTSFSGQLGPKLKEYDRQIPEGIYDIKGFNPYSAFHLSLMLNYPNQTDIQHGRQDGRKKLGNNIFIHGKAASVGCLSIGDPAIEEVFVLAKRVGLNNTKVIIAPNDLRTSQALTKMNKQPAWINGLYANISQALSPYKA